MYARLRHDLVTGCWGKYIETERQYVWYTFSVSKLIILELYLKLLETPKGIITRPEAYCFLPASNKLPLKKPTNNFFSIWQQIILA